MGWFSSKDEADKAAEQMRQTGSVEPAVKAFQEGKITSKEFEQIVAKDTVQRDKK